MVDPTAATWPDQNPVASVKLKSRTRMAGATMSKDSSPLTRSAGDMASTLLRSSMRLSLKRKFLTPQTMRPPSTRNVPSRVIPVMIFW